MMGVVDDVKGILSVSIKVRHDGYADQFSRILMVRIMMVGALIIGLNWSSDDIKCIVPKDLIDAKYVSSACWINGLYVYEEIRYHADDLGYYGVPRQINHDGKLKSGHLCAQVNLGHKVTPGCEAMTKTFFLQYQYLVFVIACLAALYYSPYILFKLANTDFISLKDNLASK